ncbi:mCG148256 [Mus musculus]|nr:mCG148256 [Mus musculus]
MFSDTNTGFTLLASLGAGQGQVLIPAVSLQDGEVKRKKEEEEGGGRKRWYM